MKIINKLFINLIILIFIGTTISFIWVVWIYIKEARMKNMDVIFRLFLSTLIVIGLIDIVDIFKSGIKLIKNIKREDE